MKKDWTPVEVLSHSRHDWLNKIQLIKGNLSLHNYDRVKEIIEEIVIEAQSEARLSQLQTPQFAALLLTCNWNQLSFTLDYELLEGQVSGQVQLDDSLITSWMSTFFECLQSSIQEYADNHLSITIDRQVEGTRFFLDFQGIITNKERIGNYTTDNTQGNLEVVVQEMTEQEFALEVFYPYE